MLRMVPFIVMERNETGEVLGVEENHELVLYMLKV